MPLTTQEWTAGVPSRLKLEIMEFLSGTELAYNAEEMAGELGERLAGTEFWAYCIEDELVMEYVQVSLEELVEEGALESKEINQYGPGPAITYYRNKIC